MGDRPEKFKRGRLRPHSRFSKLRATSRARRTTGGAITRRPELKERGLQSGQERLDEPKRGSGKKNRPVRPKDDALAKRMPKGGVDEQGTTV